MVGCLPKIEFVGWKVFFKNIKTLFNIDSLESSSSESDIILNYEENLHNLEEPLIDIKYREYLYSNC